MKNRKSIPAILLILVLLSVLLGGCGGRQTDTSHVTVHFLNVGQADCILIVDGSAAMLIDAGNNADTDTVIEYIKNQGITKLNYVVGTHPHEDHIGGLDGVIDTFSVEYVIMPEVAHATQTFEDVLTAIENKGLTVTSPVPGTTYTLEKSSFTILAPNSDTYAEMNDYSVVIRLIYGETSFLFTGDAGTASENEMLAAKFDLQADVLKVAHHGSETATSEEFLDAVQPTYAVISVGSGNNYGLPDEEVLSRLEDRGIETLRTDDQGTIRFVSDGTEIKLQK